MEYLARVNGEMVEIPKRQFIAWNNEHSARYHDATPDEKRRIVAFLYDINLPLFRSNSLNLPDKNDREDYEQEVFFHLTRALQKYRPGEGSFIHFLRKFYVKKAREEVFGETTERQEIKAAAAGEEIIEPNQIGVRHDQNQRVGAIKNAFSNQNTELPPLDPILKRRLERILTHEQYRALDLRVLQGRSLEQVASAMDISVSSAYHRLKEALTAARIEMERDRQPKTQEQKDATRYLTRAEFCRLFSLTRRALQMLLAKDIPARQCPHMIDAADYLPIQGGRIRYLETAAGLVHPTFIMRKSQENRNPLRKPGIPAEGKADGKYRRST